jgi:hypothetical protein
MTNTGALLFDGASRKGALIWLSQTYPGHSAYPLLYNTPYEALGDVGPVLLDADEGSALHTAWLRGAPSLQHAVWLKTQVSHNDLYACLRRRLRVRSPDGRGFWLRLADARSMLRAWHAQAQWPDGFWYGVAEVWLHDGSEPFVAWKNETGEYDCTQATQDIQAQIVLDWSLLAVLAKPGTGRQGVRL